jgi:hypothetical protein
MLSVNDLLIEVKAKQSRSPNEKGLLIREMFLLWYALVEGVECENFSESDLTGMLNKCIEQYKVGFYNDADCTFMAGWIFSISFWILDSAFGEEEGKKMLIAAYKSQPTNKLFKWANRDELNLTKKEIETLGTELLNSFYQYYNYGPYIKEYFLDVISTPIS